MTDEEKKANQREGLINVLTVVLGIFETDEEMDSALEEAMSRIEEGKRNGEH